MDKSVILTGLRANNDLQIGNYFGAILPMVDMAKNRSDEYQVNLFVPDLHSFTTPIDHTQLQGQIMNNLRLFVAAGLPLNSQNVHIYRQSYVPAHSELTWILNCFTSFGELGRMNQFKEKAGIRDNSRKSLRGMLYDSMEEKISHIKVTSGLYSYPVLMAADILLYDARYVPVGDDQTQHLEFTRDIAMRMNNKFGELFTVPESVQKQHEFFGKDQGLRIMDLQEPSKKMSKSDETGKGVIFLNDKPEDARKKVMSATTDSIGKISYDPQNQPGLANLLDIYELLGGAKEEFIGQDQYGPFKAALGDKIVAFLEDFQKKLSQVDVRLLEDKLQSSEAAMNEQAKAKLYKVQKAVGLR